MAKYAVLCENGNHLEAWNLYRERGPLVTVLRYNTFQSLLSQCMNNGNLTAAITIFEDMKEVGFIPNKVTYSMLISALSKNGRKGLRFREFAYKYWQEMEKAHRNLDVAGLRTGMQACINVGRVKEAERLVSRIEVLQGKPDVRAFNILINGYAKRGETEKLEEIFKHIKESGLRPSVSTYNTMIASSVRNGKMDGAEKYLELAHGDGILPDAWTYTTLIKGYMDKMQYDTAARIWEEMEDAGIRPTVISYSVMIDGHINNGNLQKAREVFDMMLIRGQAPSAITFNSLLKGYAESGEPTALKNALAVLDEMQRNGVPPVTDTFNALMSTAISADEVDIALKLYNRMLSIGQFPDGLTYTILMQAYARKGRLSEAVDTFEQFSRDPNAHLDIAAYNALVNALACSGEMVAAEKMLERACNFASKANIGPPVEAFGAVVSGYVRLKLVRPAVETVRKFHGLGGTPDIQMLDQLIDLCIRTGDYKVAMQAVRAMELVGIEVDKTKYKALIQQELPNSIAASSEKRKSSGRESNMYLERFKFWLGLPNNYYG